MSRANVLMGNDMTEAAGCSAKLGAKLKDCDAL